ncbi:hypothetical protein NIES4102_30330 [Chondrocystis sp. NIES-4102]|nr:hypothetical protein NIES4102_30330 [Chondrocystis sp. NIES-4102]
MNSENPSIPKSDKTNFETIEFVDKQSEQISSESNTDAWLDEEIVDVTSQIITQSTPEQKAQLDSDFNEVSEVSHPNSFVLTQEEVSELSPSTPSAPKQIDSQVEDLITPAKPTPEPEFIVDRWLDESTTDVNSPMVNVGQVINIKNEIVQLEEQKAALYQELEQLKTHKEQFLAQQLQLVQENLEKLLQEGTKELQERKMSLQIEIEKLERRKERINQEMRSNFAGSSQELAVRIQGFKDYLVGSLQDLARAAEKLELARTSEVAAPRNREQRQRNSENSIREERNREINRARDPRGRASNVATNSQTQFSEPTFADQSRRIRQLLDQYRNNPDYYGSPWQLRRTFEAVHAKKVQDWFFVQGGRGAVDSMGSRLQNILVASAVISILYNLYGDRCRVLVLTDTPENLGEWRRGLQDCLGISRNNFGTNSGVVLFDAPEILVQRAERLLQDKLLPIIIVDETEELLNLSVLKFPLWLAFASKGKSSSSNYLY